MPQYTTCLRLCSSAFAYSCIAAMSLMTVSAATRARSPVRGFTEQRWMTQQKKKTDLSSCASRAHSPKYINQYARVLHRDPLPPPPTGLVCLVPGAVDHGPATARGWRGGPLVYSSRRGRSPGVHAARARHTVKGSRRVPRGGGSGRSGTVPTDVRQRDDTPTDWHPAGVRTGEYYMRPSRSRYLVDCRLFCIVNIHDIISMVCIYCT